MLSRLRELEQAGLKDAPSTLAALSQAARRVLPDLSDWRQAPRDWFIPTGQGRVTNDIANASAAFRNRFMFRLLVPRVRRGERVFVVAGASHAVELEPALSAAFGRPAIRQRGLAPTRLPGNVE